MSDQPTSLIPDRIKRPQSNVTIRIDSPTLISLLSDGAKLEIDSFAAEKVAEHVIQKVAAGRINKQVDDALKRMQTELINAFSSKWRFPREARDYIAQVIKEVAAEEVSKAIVLAKAKIDMQSKEMVERREKEFNERLTVWWKKNSEDLHAGVKAQARAEFLDVLKEARSAGL